MSVCRRAGVRSGPCGVFTRGRPASGHAGGVQSTASAPGPSDEPAGRMRTPSATAETGDRAGCPGQVLPEQSASTVRHRQAARGRAPRWHGVKASTTTRDTRLRKETGRGATGHGGSWATPSTQLCLGPTPPPPARARASPWPGTWSLGTGGAAAVTGSPRLCRRTLLLTHTAPRGGARGGCGPPDFPGHSPARARPPAKHPPFLSGAIAKATGAPPAPPSPERGREGGPRGSGGRTLKEGQRPDCRSSKQRGPRRSTGAKPAPPPSREDPGLGPGLQAESATDNPSQRIPGHRPQAVPRGDSGDLPQSVTQTVSLKQGWGVTVRFLLLVQLMIPGSWDGALRQSPC